MEAHESSIKHDKYNDRSSMDSETDKDEAVDAQDHEQSIGSKVKDEGEDLEMDENVESDDLNIDDGWSTVKFYPEVQSESKPKVGMSFNSEDDAYEYYNAYARSAGFTITKNHLKKRGGKVYFRQFTCNKHCFRRMHTVDGQQAQAKVKCRCLADMRIFFSKKTNTWIVTNWREQHNHPFRNMGTKLPCASSNGADKPRPSVGTPEQNIGIHSQLSTVLALEATRADNLCFTGKKVGDHLIKTDTRSFENGCRSIIDYFTRKKAEDPKFYASFQLDEHGELGNCFWVDDISRQDYYVFGDALVLDTSDAKNKVNMPYVPFVGINNHWQGTTFGCALLMKETVESFEWVFKEWLNAMGGTPPKLIITNQHQPMEAAIAKVFTDSVHMHGMWDMTDGFSKYLAHMDRMHPNFKKTWNDCIYASENAEEFEERWKNMFDAYPKLKDIEWVQNVWDDRMKWCHVYSSNVFLAGTHNFQWEKGGNEILRKIVDRSTPMHDFVEIVEKNIWRSRYEENILNQGLNDGCLPSITGCPLENDMMEIFTRTTFEKIQNEIQGLVKCVPKVESILGGRRYVITDFSETLNREYVLTFHDNSKEISKCTCNRWEREGIICRHVFWVLRIESFEKLPPKYILRRWTRNAKDNRVVDFDGGPGQLQNYLSLRKGHLSFYANKCIFFGAQYESCYDHVLEGLVKLSLEAERLNKIEELKARTKEPNHKMVEPAHENAKSSSDLAFGDSQPFSMKKPGSRLKCGNGFSKATRTCGTCGKPGHDSRNCAMKMNNGSLSSKIKLIKPPRTCKHCKDSGHDKRNCPKMKGIVIVDDDAGHSAA